MSYNIHTSILFVFLLLLWQIMLILKVLTCYVIQCVIHWPKQMTNQKHWFSLLIQRNGNPHFCKFHSIQMEQLAMYEMCESKTYNVSTITATKASNNCNSF
jgi:hypothetical protein